MRIITDAKAAEITSALGLTIEQAEQGLRDAPVLWQKLREREQAGNDWPTENEIRIWAESQGVAPDRVTAALALLRAAGRIFVLDADPAIFAEPTVMETSRERATHPALLEELDRAKLVERAGAFNVKGRHTMKKAELIREITKAEQRHAGATAETDTSE